MSESKGESKGDSDYKGSKDDHFSCSTTSCQTGLTYLTNTSHVPAAPELFYSEVQCGERHHHLAV